VYKQLLIIIQTQICKKYIFLENFLFIKKNNKNILNRVKFKNMNLISSIAKNVTFKQKFIKKIKFEKILKKLSKTILKKISCTKISIFFVILLKIVTRKLQLNKNFCKIIIKKYNFLVNIIVSC
jgi:hypothetical protein